MGHTVGRVREIRLGASGHTQISIACPAGAIPRPGQYLLAAEQDHRDAILSTPCFAIEASNLGFWAAPLYAVAWSPGTALDLVGPLGHGFDLPGNIQRLGFVALGETVSRLMPLVYQAVHARTAMTLFTDLDLPMLSAAVEVYPLASLPEALDWPDYLALDLPLGRLDELRGVLGLAEGAILPCPAQVLVTTPIPCAGLAQCGACAIPSRRGWKLVCEDGPVFDLTSLKW